MLKKIMPVTWQIIFNGVEIYNNQPQAVTTTQLN